MCRRGTGGQGRGRGPQAAPRRHQLWAQAPHCWDRGALTEVVAGGRKGPALGTASGSCHPGVPHPMLLPRTSLSSCHWCSWPPSCLARSLVTGWGSAGVSESQPAAGATPAGWPVPGTRGTHRHVPGRDKRQEAFRSRGQCGSGGGHCFGCRSNRCLRCIFLPSPISLLGPGNGRQQRAAAGSGGQQAQRPGKETEHDKASTPRPCTAPAPSRLGPGRPRPAPGRSQGQGVLQARFNLPDLQAWLENEK